jgi:hypothetical protein
VNQDDWASKAANAASNVEKVANISFNAVTSIGLRVAGESATTA